MDEGNFVKGTALKIIKFVLNSISGKKLEEIQELIEDESWIKTIIRRTEKKLKHDYKQMENSERSNGYVIDSNFFSSLEVIEILQKHILMNQSTKEALIHVYVNKFGSETLSEFENNLNEMEGIYNGYLLGSIPRGSRVIWKLIESRNSEKNKDDEKDEGNEKTFITTQPVRETIDLRGAPDDNVFYGRKKELKLLTKWILSENCKLVSISGIRGQGKTQLSLKFGKGGIGKTDLSINIAKSVSSDFDFVIFRSLLNAPKLNEKISEIIEIISDHRETELLQSSDEIIDKFIYYLNKKRCLIILDNFDSVLLKGNERGEYLPGYENYGNLLVRVSLEKHSSCILITTRELPQEIFQLEAKNRKIHSLELEGLDFKSRKKYFLEFGKFSGSENDWKKILRFYEGNPLAIEIVAKHINYVLNGNLSEFIKLDRPIFKDINELLDWHFERLSEKEKEIVFWLSISREPVTIEELLYDLKSRRSQDDLFSTIQSLKRKIPIEYVSNKITLQPFLIEFFTEKIINSCVKEIEDFDENFTEMEYADRKKQSGYIDRKDYKLLKNNSIIKVNSKDSIIDSQRRIIIKEILKKLESLYSNKDTVREKLYCILGRIIKDGKDNHERYLLGNILNLILELDGCCKDIDFSNSCINQVDFRGKTLYNINFSKSRFRDTIFTDTFGLILSSKFSRDGNFLATGSGNSDIQLWKMPEGSQTANLVGHKSWVVALDISDDNIWLASGSNDKTIKIWNLLTGECVHTLKGCNESVRSVAFNKKGNLLISGSEDKTIRVWDISSEKQLIKIKIESAVRAVGFLPGNENIAVSAGSNNKIQFWDLETKSLVKDFDGHKDWVRTFAFSPDGIHLASGSSDKTIKIWNLGTNKCEGNLIGHKHPVMVVAYDDTGETIISSSNDGTIKIWDRMTKQCVKTLIGHNNWVRAMAFCPKRGMIASGSDDLSIKLWDHSSGECLTTLTAYINPMWCVTTDRNAQFASCSNGLIFLWDSQNPYLLKELKGHSNRIWCVEMSQDGRRLISASDDQTVRQWDIKTGECINKFTNHKKRVWSVDYNFNGELIASAGEDQIYIWDANTGGYVNGFSENKDCLRKVKFHPSMNYLASSGEDAVIRIWDISNNECILELKGHSGWIWGLVFSYDGKKLISGSDDGAIIVWDLARGESEIIEGHDHYVRSVAVDNEGKYIVSGSADRSVKLWDFNSHKLIHSFEGHEGWVWSVKFNSDNSKIISCSEDETVKWWDIESKICIKEYKCKKPYEGVNITGVEGLSEAQKRNLINLGAVSFSK